MDNTVKSSADFQIREKTRKLENLRYKASDSAPPKLYAGIGPNYEPDADEVNLMTISGSHSVGIGSILWQTGRSRRRHGERLDY